MKILFLPLLFILPALAQEDCPDEPAGGGLSNHVHDERILALAKNDKNEYKIIRVDSHPIEITPNGVKYRVQPPLRLKPGECGYFSVPASLRNKPVLFVNMGHRQAEGDNTGWNAQTKHDSKPGLTTVQVNETNIKGESRWRYWGGSSSGKFGAKFAEPRYDMEMEGLYEWSKNGHSDVKTNSTSHAPVNADGMRLCSVGDDPVSIGSLELKVFPGKAAKYMEHNFGTGNKMGDSLTAEGRNYGELPALILNGHNTKAIPKDWKMEPSGRSVSIPLPVGKKLKTFEIAVSDTHASTLSGHDDNEHTTAGWAKLNVMIKRKDGTSIPIIKRENVPPRGVLIGTPDSDIVLKEGDELVIGAESDKLHVLGMKIGID